LAFWKLEFRCAVIVVARPTSYANLVACDPIELDSRDLYSLIGRFEPNRTREERKIGAGRGA
jgi:hypothetical protein